jgi:hypothetical protein
MINTPKRFFLGFLTIVFFTLLLYAINLYQSNINWEQQVWQPISTVPAFQPIGIDFRDGLYNPAMLLRNTGSFGVIFYPPLVFLMALPFTFFSVEVAYSIQVGLLYIANILAILMAAFLVQRILSQIPGIDDTDRPLLLAGIYGIAGLVFFLNITSYGFLFSIERGNFDISVILLMLLALILMDLRPQSIWLPVICVSVAAHLKIYPLLLFGLLFWRFHWKMAIPSLVVNLALLLILGPANASNFLISLISQINSTYFWFGNHSASSFADFIGNFNSSLGALSLVYKIVPLVIWLAAMIFLWLKHFNLVNVLLLFAISVPVMCTTPDISHDYKLVILVTPLLIMLCLLLLNYQKTGKIYDMLVVGLILGIFLFILRPAGFSAPLLANKYPFILLFEILIFIRIPALSRNLSPVILDII